MREILVLQLGGFGNKMGVKFWEEMLKDSEFGNDNEQGNQNNKLLLNTSNIVYYNLHEKKPLPRCIQVDLGQDLPYSNIDFNPCNQFSFNYSSGNNFGFVKNHCSNEIIDILIDSTRQEIEKCDSFQGFQIFASIIGGTGSGLSAVLSQKLKDEYNSVITQCNLLVPSIKQNDTCVVSPYNAFLALNQLMESTQQLIFFDNQGLKQNLSRLGIQFDYDDANLHVAQTICCNSSPFRNPGDINSSLRKLSTNLVPFPELKLFTCSQSNNQFSDYYKEYLKMDEYQIFKELMSSDHNQASTDYTHGRFLTAALSLRGNISNKQIDKYNSLFQHFLENNAYYNRAQKAKKINGVNMFFTNICKKPLSNYEFFGSSIINSTSIAEQLKNLDEKFNKMHIRKCYMYKYTQEGIEEDEFIEAKSRVEDICRYYEDKYNEDVGEDHENWE
ncbi:unnamed protein product [Paramecium primaurelia]|uniref:Tubulin/FtsZ GTPase domain-containing protein n=1 Tax=Paramecium primaurelia TaxID=5886 RepID=A0A8S1PSQ7_PARPR|nr:unnamed protein product [Paramecium primaurelia]